MDRSGKEAIPGLEALLSLHGEVFVMESGYWTRIEAWQVEPNEHVPHGIRYCLTLHDRNNHRVLGYDNAHAVQGRRRRFEGKRVVWDHRHQGDRISPYEFHSPAGLLEDFWADVRKRIDGSQR